MNEINTTPRWGNYKQARAHSGLSVRLLQDYVKDGLIRSSVVTKPGAKRGVRLLDLHSLDDLIEAGVGSSPVSLAMNASRGNAPHPQQNSLKIQSEVVAGHDR